LKSTRGYQQFSLSFIPRSWIEEGKPSHSKKKQKKNQIEKEENDKKKSP